MGKKKPAADGVPAKVPAPVSPAHGLVPDVKAPAPAPASAKQQQSGGSKKPAVTTKASKAKATPENPLLVRRTGPCADDLSCGDRCKLLAEEFGSMLVVSMIWAGVMAALRYWNAAHWEPYVALYIVTTVFAWVFNLAMVLVWPEYSITQIVLSSSTLAAQQKKAAQKKGGKPSSAAAALASQTKLWDWTLEHPWRSLGWTLVFIYVQAVSVLDSDLVSEKQRQSFGEKISSPTLMWGFFVLTFLLFIGTLSEYSCPRLFKDKKSKKHKLEKGYVLVNEDLDTEVLSDDDVDPMEGDLNGDNELSTFEIFWKYKYYFLSLAVVFVYFATVSNTLLIAPTDFDGTKSFLFRESWTKPSVLITMWLFTGLLAINLANRLVCPKLARRFEIVPNPKTASPLPFGTKLVMLGVMLLFFLKSPVTLFQQHSCAGSLYRYHAHESRSYHIVDKAFEDLAHRLSESAAPQYDFKTHTDTAGARASFNKAHGCVRASFRVSDRLSPPDRVGLFSELGKEYNAWVRFSSGSSLRQDDRIRDVRGMSVKLFGVSGKKLTENLLEQMNSKYHQGYGGATDELNAEVDSHDLEFSTGETFPIVDPLQYLRLSDALKEIGSTWTLLSLMFPSWNPWTWSPSLRYNLMKWYDGGDVSSPLDATYYSQTPYRFGVDGTTHAVKYKMLPCDVNTYNLTAQERLGGSYLRENMRARLSPASAKTDTCFDLFVQRQEEACRDNLDDPTHPWQSQWYQLGTLTIARQEFLARDQIAFCENIKFNPWQALPEHAPLGPINNARAISYLMGAKDRHRLNKVKPVAVTGNEVFTKSQLPNPYVGAGLVRNYEYAAYAAPFEDLPRYVKDFQTVDQFKPAKLAKLGVRVVQSTWFSSGLHLLQGKTGSVKDFILNKGDSAVPEDYADLVNHAYSTAAASKSNWTVDQYWRNDVEFARQFISGVHANWIRAVRPGVDPVPAVFQPNAEEVAAIKAITGGASVEDLVSENRLFYTDYEILEGVTMVPGRFFYIPVVLLYVDTRINKLMPLAVQLTRNPHKHNRVFTPAVQPKGMSDGDFKKSNEYLVWLFVKMHAACSDGQVHQSISHLGKTHLTLEPLILGWHRQLASDHILMTMMTPHFVDTLAINNLGRQTLLAMGSHSDFQRVTAMGLTGTQQLMEKAHSKWDIKKSRFLNDLAERGFPEGSNNLPGYLYKDFGTRIWKAMKKYVTDMLTGHYKTDAAVLADKQVQAMVDELYDPDMGAVPGDKPNLNSIDELAEFVTGVMFIASAGHSVVNFGQFDYYAFVPNRPLFLTRLVPEDTTLVDMPYIMHSLPDPDVAEETIILARTLTYLEDQGLLAAYQNATAFEPVRKINPTVFNAYTATLKTIDDEIARENARAREYYPYLQPTYIMPSISI